MTTEIGGSMTLYHPRGPQARLWIPCDPQAAFAHVTACLEAGWLTAPAGCEPGENKDLVGWVCRCVSNDSPCLLLYPNNDQLTYSFVRVYLNNEEDIHAFEHASGMKLDQLPEYVGEGKPQRGKSKATDNFIVRAKTPFQAVVRDHPKYNEDDRKAAIAAGKTYTVPKSQFVRWGSEAPAGAAPAAEKQASAPSSNETDPVKVAVGAWDIKLDPDTVNLAKMNSFLPDVKAITDKRVRFAVWEKLVAFAREAKWEFDDIAKEFVSAADVPFAWLIAIGLALAGGVFA